MDTVPTEETRREPTVWRFEQRSTITGQILDAWPLIGRDPEAAWQRFRLELKLHPHAYTPHGMRRLVLIGGAK